MTYAMQCYRLVKKVLKGIDLEVQEGEFTMITGPSGSGKSTLFSAIGGLSKPDSGYVTLFSHDLYQMDQKKAAEFRRKNIGYVFQNLHLIAGLTVFENIALASALSGFDKITLEERIFEILSLLGIEGKHHYYIERLSQGEKQVVAIARALINRPKILLMDEPTAFLDHGVGVQVMTLIRQKVLDEGLTVISNTSDVRLHPFAHRVIKLIDGEVHTIYGEMLRGESPPPFLKI